MINKTYLGIEPLPGWFNEVMLMREFGWTERELKEDVTMEKLHQIALIYELESRKEKMSSSSMSIPRVSNRKMR